MPGECDQRYALLQSARADIRNTGDRLGLSIRVVQLSRIIYQHETCPNPCGSRHWRLQFEITVVRAVGGYRPPLTTVLEDNFVSWYRVLTMSYL